jgi:hypothetical protein
LAADPGTQKQTPQIRNPSTSRSPKGTLDFGGRPWDPKTNTNNSKPRHPKVSQGPSTSAVDPGTQKQTAIIRTPSNPLKAFLGHSKRFCLGPTRQAPRIENPSGPRSAQGPSIVHPTAGARGQHQESKTQATQGQPRARPRGPRIARRKTPRHIGNPKVDPGTLNHQPTGGF